MWRYMNLQFVWKWAWSFQSPFKVLFLEALVSSAIFSSPWAKNGIKLWLQGMCSAKESFR